jgi:hypothetical protein
MKTNSKREQAMKFNEALFIKNHYLYGYCKCEGWIAPQATSMAQNHEKKKQL